MSMEWADTAGADVTDRMTRKRVVYVPLAAHRVPRIDVTPRTFGGKTPRPYQLIPNGVRLTYDWGEQDGKPYGGNWSVTFMATRVLVSGALSDAGPQSVASWDLPDWARELGDELARHYRPDDFPADKVI